MNHMVLNNSTLWTDNYSKEWFCFYPLKSVILADTKNNIFYVIIGSKKIQKRFVQFSFLIILLQTSRIALICSPVHPTQGIESSEKHIIYVFTQYYYHSNERSTTAM